MCQISESKAYAIIKQLNEELKEKGFIVFRGRVSKAYFMEKMYGMKEDVGQWQIQDGYAQADK